MPQPYMDRLGHPRGVVRNRELRLQSKIAVLVKRGGHSRATYAGEVDYVFAYCPDNNEVYWVDLANNKSTTSVSYRLDEPEYMQPKIRFAKDYKLDTLAAHMLR